MATTKRIGPPDERPRKENKYDGAYALGPAGAKSPPLLLGDGTLEVENLTERASEEFSYEITSKQDNFIFVKKLDENTDCQIIPKYVDKVYKTKVSLKQEVSKAFAVYRNDVKRFIIKDLDRYKTSRKAVRKEIDKIEKDRNQFLFTERKSGSLWNKLYIDSTMFGPYNYDVRLDVTKDIDAINDLLVIRTGAFMPKYDRKTKNAFIGPSGYGIAWVSPHNTLVYSGQGLYLSTGETIITGGSDFNTEEGMSYWLRHLGITSGVASHALSSKFIRIPKGQVLWSGMHYDFYSDRGSLSAVTEVTDPLFQDFYYIYPEYKDHFAISGWDGIVPSGVPFTIDTWSSNPRYVGFDGEITINPSSEEGIAAAEDVSCSYELEGWAIDKDYQKSVRKAIKQAKKRFYRKLNKVLVDKGIKTKSARITRFEILLERVAQNAYDGLSMVRNEQIAKAQGLESNPLNSPIYYDGTSKMYGGNKDGALFNHDDTKAYRYAGDGSSGTGTDSSSTSNTSEGLSDTGY